jgi:predicted metal-dependent phosphoesterase TrpH
MMEPPLHRVCFEKPDLDILTRSHVVVDLHVHTRHSDGRHTSAQIADQARKLGIGVAITDHNAIAGALEMAQHKDLLSIPGIEVTSREGAHVLVYFENVTGLERFYRRHVQPNLGLDVMSSTELPLEQIIARARDYASLVILAHPYSAMYTGVFNPSIAAERLQRLLDSVDGVEVINAENLGKWNLQCAVLGFNLGKAMTGGSDGHTRHHVGRAVTCAVCAPNRRAFLDAVRQGRSRVVGKEIAMVRKVSSSSAKLRSGLRHCPELLEKNLRYGRRVLQFKSRALRDNVYAALTGGKQG